MHDWLFQNVKDLTDVTYDNDHAKRLGLSSGTFASCMSNQSTSTISADVASAGRLNITGTPTFFVGSLQSDGTMIVRERIHGAVSVDRFRESINKALRGSS